MKRLLLFLSLIAGGEVIAQADSLQADIAESVAANEASIEALEDSLFQYRNQVFEADNDYDRMLANDAFTEMVRTVTKHPRAFAYPFQQLKSVSTVKSPDGAFRLFNWNVENDDRTHSYFCFIVKNDKAKSVIELIESPIDPRNPEKVVLNEYEWMGAVYYDIIPVKRKGKTYYTLLGWDGNDRITTRKLIEVFSWSINDNLKLGAPLFKSNSGLKKRIVFEHNGDVSMSLRYEKEKERIVFNHIAPMEERLAGNVEYYIPDLSFDAYELEKGKWFFAEDVDVRLERKMKNNFYNFPKDPIKRPNSKK